MKRTFAALVMSIDGNYVHIVHISILVCKEVNIYISKYKVYFVMIMSRLPSNFQYS